MWARNIFLERYESWDVKDEKGLSFEDLGAGWCKQRKQQLKGFEMGRNLMYSKKENAIGKQGKVWVLKQ